MTIAANPYDINASAKNAFKDPFAWFFAEHYRHRLVCHRLLEYADSDILDIAGTKDVLTFLQTDFPLHILDEEADLFPMLLRRCTPEDNLERTIDLLTCDHHAESETVKTLIDALEVALNGRTGLGLVFQASDVVEAFCAPRRRHIALENAVVLPIARLRLTKADKRKLGRRLAARRGLSDPFKKTS